MVRGNYLINQTNTNTMKTIISGYIVDNFGSNNYSHGMEAIVFNPKDVSVREVEKLTNVFLHPTVEPNSLEIFALMGTAEQFNSFYRDAVSSYCAKKAFDKFGYPTTDEGWTDLNRYAEDEEFDFVPWYIYYSEPVDN